MTRFLLHIGRHKTGTSSLQHFLFLNRERLEAQGLYYPRAGLAQVAHHDIALFLHHKKFERLPAAEQERLERTMQALRDETTGCDGTVLISSEYLQNCRPEQVAAHFPPDHTRIVVYIRERMEYLVSSYQQRVHRTGYVKALRDYVNETPVDYDGFLAAWERVYGKERIVLRAYSRPSLAGEDIVADFVGVVGIDLDAGLTRPEQDYNPSIGGAVLELKRLMNRRAGEGRTPRLMYKALSRVAAADALHRRRPLLDRAEIERIREASSAADLSLFDRRFGGRDPFTRPAPHGPQGARLDDAELLVVIQLLERHAPQACAQFCADQGLTCLGDLLRDVDAGEPLPHNLYVDRHLMDPHRLITALHQGLLHRDPRPDELAHWSARLDEGLDAETLTQRLLASEEFAKVKHKVQSLFVPPGHFYSPVVDVASVRERYGRVQPNVAPPAIALDREAQLRHWSELLPALQTIPFPEDPAPGFRYHFRNPAFSYADGSLLHAMLRTHRPRRLVEVGSGWSSACAIDTIERYLDGAVEVSFVEPYPALLLELLGDAASRHTVHAVPVQQADPAVFAALQDGDFLFIDSTHVMKTGSDVCHELFEVLPSLAPGVFVHFHDIFWPFEYGPNWIVKENRSWNEIYGLRAFLMYNDAFEIVFFNDWFARNARQRIEADYPAMLKNTGGSLWLRKRR